MRVAAPVYMTPPEVAASRGVSVKKVLLWIETGELVAVNLATSRQGRPRWKISKDALQRFESARQSLPAVPIAPRRKKSATRVIEFV